MEISFININFSFRRITNTQFSELFLCLLLLKNNQPKIILMHRDIFFGRQILLLSALNATNQLFGMFFAKSCSHNLQQIKITLHYLPQIFHLVVCHF